MSEQTTPVVSAEAVERAYWQIPLDDVNRETIREVLAALGIEVRDHG